MSAFQILTVAPATLPALLIPPADMTAADYYTSKRSDPAFVRALLALTAQLAEGAPLLAAGISPETIDALTAEISTAADLAQSEPDPAAEDALLQQGYAIPINGAYTMFAEGDGVMLSYGRVGIIRRNLRDAAAARALATRTKGLPFKSTGGQPQLTDAALATLATACRDLNIM